MLSNMDYNVTVKVLIHSSFPRNIEKRFVYFGDLSNTLSNKPTEEPLVRATSFDRSQGVEITSGLNKKTYGEVSKAGFLQEALADTFSSVA
ncbi:hypothetical protein OK016_17220 [Vibrio chagasii]|nr:hypothetical protein [Vibrio chagasii]